jgi:CPA2 family monovalent cation:H+ antiporter-2
MLLDLDFVVSEWSLLAILTAMVFVTNTFVNALIFRAFGVSVGESLYGGALLAPIGEFSFILAAVGEQAGVITSFAYQATLATITLTLLLASAWSAMLVQLAKRAGHRAQERTGGR